MRFHNPIAFRPLPVTILTSVIYIALFIALLLVHTVLPSAPTGSLLGDNVSEAWHDLQALTGKYHPYNSHANDQVRDWILHRIESILMLNGVSISRIRQDEFRPFRFTNESSPVVVFSDTTSNASFSTEGSPISNERGHKAGISVYFEGTNIIVYIRGSADDQIDWWSKRQVPKVKGGVLVNAHYDGVSTAPAASDDGVGVVTLLQLIKHFSQPSNRPDKGIVALFNNGEEDYLNGARAFSQHPMSRFVTVFLNLEGAGAGGRATLFRSTSTEVAMAYQNSNHPFGTVLSGDAFKRGIIRSQTDYVVFNELLGLNGLDVAFMEPRARYHTDQDDTKHTSRDSLWHMLSAAMATVQALSSDTLDIKHESDGVWFDLFGSAFAVFRLNTLFALSVTLLVVAPLTLFIIGICLLRTNRFYLFSASMHHHHPEGDDNVPLSGWRGFCRFPITAIAASAAVIALAYLITRFNPYIIYSSQYAVWSMMLSTWFFSAWLLLRAADFARPSALQRVYTLLWMFVAQWIILVVVTVLERGPKIAGGYLIVFYFAGTYLATSIAFLELFGLPRKVVYADELIDASAPPSATTSRPGTSSGDQVNVPDQEPVHDFENEQEANESTSLLRHERNKAVSHQASPESGNHEHHNHGLETDKTSRIYGHEQPWSWSLPTWTWLVQFLLTAPIAVTLFGQVALLYSSATSQTLADGNSPLMVYMGMAVLSVFIVAPLAPYLHRHTYHIPAFFLLVLTGTLIYNLFAFPFSSNNRLKLFFIQRVDLDTGINSASLTGLSGRYLHSAIDSIPSATGQKPSCSGSKLRKGLIECSWDGLAPAVVKNTHPDIPPPFGYSEWLVYNVTRLGKRQALFRLWGQDTRACKIEFHKPISDFTVKGAGLDKRFKRVPNDGSKEIRLWSRTWEKPWEVNVEWEESGEDHEGSGMDGRVVCLWSDNNEPGLIPALDEIQHFVPDWVAISKLADGLVEGSKAFVV